MNKDINQNQEGWLVEYANTAEKTWKASTLNPNKFSETKLLAIFPEIKEMAMDKLNELKEWKQEILELINKLLVDINKLDSRSSLFYRALLKMILVKDLIDFERQEFRFKRLSGKDQNSIKKGYITDADIQRALSVPITSLINQPLRKVGKNFVCLCPFHKENSPSFYIYPETNSCWCFGCQKGGNVIVFLELLHGFSFIDAVKYLI